MHHISFTGSVAVGALIQAAAAKNAVPVTLELGGKSPQLVFDDADLDAALPFLVNAGIQNAGQTCSAASRILVQRGVFEEVARRMAERYRALRVGPALDDPDVGPVISARQRELVHGLSGAGRGARRAASWRSRRCPKARRRGRLLGAADADRRHRRPITGWRRRRSSARCRC